MNAHAEKQVRRLVRRMVFWRIVGALFELPGRFFGVLAAFFTQLQTVCSDVAVAVFYFELEAARKHRLLTGSDLGIASGTPYRYSPLSTGYAASVEEKIIRAQEQAE